MVQTKPGSQAGTQMTGHLPGASLVLCNSCKDDGVKGCPGYSHITP